ncbi:hypothetical protein MJD09_01595, partial [bacterium]|nr:hypothetical protein [bacterium]
EANFPFFHRLDVRLAYQRRVGHKELTFYLDFINLTDRKNIYDIIWDKEFVEDDGRIVQAARKQTFFMLPFVPSLGMSFKF